MSKGLGRIQRACLEVLKLNPNDPLDSIVITALVVERETVTESEHVSVRRALRKLASAGLVIDMQRRGWHSNRRHWALPETATKYYRELLAMGWGSSIPREHRHLVETPKKTATRAKRKAGRKGTKKGK